MPETAAPPAPAAPAPSAPAAPGAPSAPAPHPSSAPRSFESPHIARSRERLGSKVGEADGVPETRKDNATAGKTPEAKPVAPKPADLAPKAEPAPVKPAESAKPVEDAKPAKPDAKAPESPMDPLAKPALDAAGKPVPVDPKTGKLPGPWQLKEKWEKQARQYESEVVELRSKLTKLGDPDAIAKRIEAAEARAKELESEIEYKAFEKSEKYDREFAKPLQASWEAAVSTFSQLKVTEADGVTTRPATDQDLTWLAQLPEGQLDEAAEALFGKSAPRALRHVEKVRELAAASTKALADARKAGAERDTQAAAATRQAHEEVSRLWTEALASDDQSRDFLQTREDDDEWNAALDKSRSFVESAIKGNAADPKLTSAERADLVKRKAALRGRAIGYTMRGVEIKRQAARITSLEAELASVKATQPGNGDGRGGDGSVSITHGTPQARMQDRFNSRMSQP
jgi:hypothetical protein